ILPMLSKYGYGELAMTLIMQDTYPSWGYWITLGANTCWEMYESNARSRNHFFLGTYTDWFYKNLAGVADFSNGYESVVLKPEIHREIGYVDYSLKTVRGALKSHWYFAEDGKLIWEIIVPVGTTAAVYLPAEADISAYSCITDNGEYLTVPSGSYTFVMDAGNFPLNEALIPETDEKPAENKDAVLLAELIESAATLRANNFSSTEYKAFSETLKNARAVLADNNADSTAYSDAYKTLKDQMKILCANAKGNLALRRTAYASSTLDSGAWHLNKLTDGDKYNLRGSEVCGWTSNFLTATPHEEWFGIDLGAVYEVNCIQVMPAGAAKGAMCYAFPKSFVLYVSEDGERWTAVCREEDYPMPKTEMQVFDFDTVKARYVRFLATELRTKPSDSNKHRMQIAEIEVYNTENK
ncbi:MAG: discoidin domain-containing protein, partial [Clostridia bacterium]|nr:discoidin domain-containing protein [Clostridia bacterium]